MSQITKVALAGATGNLGPAVLNELLEAGFEVTALVREGGARSFPLRALQGQDAVVVTLGSASFSKQHNLIEASVKAGVKRFILRVRLSYTLIINGPFLDWGLRSGFIFDVKGKSAQLLDGGDRTFSATTLSGVGKAIAGVLKNPEATKNRTVFVQEVETTQKALLEKAKKAIGADGWTVEEVPVATIVAAATEELKKPNPNPGVWVVPFIKAAIFGEGYESHYKTLDNDLLGVKQLTDDELQAVVDDVAKA
ncbi:unnamed protein product [Parascedosporium putredinis]|uniref:NmrA-like domain-containing protein n=1 Tax=Parascedosporium putredinis TaxID=1442378 RepID=A0A9P1H8X5_9PEZI|nr:unnamed protein product [Parascedosporium putredinis]CAI8001155.1 unnamed protein product [Parascedosporium putredinis]